MPSTSLALGTNLGRPSDNLRAALRGLASEIYITAVSPVYETAPMYIIDQPHFLNIAVRGETNLSPTKLLAFVKALETKLGRSPSSRFGPRLIDIDILFYGDKTTDLPGLVIPHPRLAERAFVLRPLADIAPDWVVPSTGQTVAEMLAALPDDPGVILKFTAFFWE